MNSARAGEMRSTRTTGVTISEYNFISYEILEDVGETLIVQTLASSVQEKIDNVLSCPPY